MTALLKRDDVKRSVERCLISKMTHVNTHKINKQSVSLKCIINNRLITSKTTYDDFSSKITILRLQIDSSR